MSNETPRGWKGIISWAFYDWGNSAFATVVIAGLFPVFYGSYWRPESTASATQSTLELGIGNSIASLVVAVLAPILGAIADRGSAKKRFLSVFALLGIVMTTGLFLVPEGVWWAALVVYALATIGFSGANVFYDSLLVAVAPGKRADFASALGYSLGYLGGGLLFTVNVLMVQKPEWFGISDPTLAVRMAFLSVGVWWGLFTIPLLMNVPEPRGTAKLGLAGAATSGWSQLMSTFREIRSLKQIWMFLLAYWLYIDGVHTIIRMATKYGQSLGFDQGTLITALLVTQFVGFPSAIVFGKLGERIGAKRGILIGISVYAVTSILSAFMSAPIHFFALAVVVGLVQGGVQALSRSYYSRLIPADKAGEFFGFYNMLGKFAAILGPLLMGVAGWATGSIRLSIVSLIILFIGGAVLLVRVEEKE